MQNKVATILIRAKKQKRACERKRTRKKTKNGVPDHCNQTMGCGASSNKQDKPKEGTGILKSTSNAKEKSALGNTFETTYMNT